MKQESGEKERRLAILINLSLAMRYKCAIVELRNDLDDAGYPASLDRIRADCAWLDETGLVKYDFITGVVTATARGLDIAQGYSEVPGVARPGLA